MTALALTRCGMQQGQIITDQWPSTTASNQFAKNKK